MTERVYVRQLDDGQWQWRVLNDDGSWKQDIHEVSPEELTADLKQLNLPVCLLVDGRSAVTRTMPVEGTEKKLLSKILPYEIEEELIDPVEDLHFCFGNVEDEKVNLVYLGMEQLEKVLAYIEPSGSEVQYILPDYLTLDQNGFSGILLMEGDHVIAKFGDGIGFKAELNVAQFVLAQLITEEDPREIDSLLLVAPHVEGIAELKTCIPESWLEEEKELHLDEQLSDYFWEYCDPSCVSTPLNMRSGAFARQLPFVRWWQMWKVPAYAVAAAFVISLSINFIDYMSAKNEGKKIRTQIQEVYLKAVPNGRTGDEEKRLRALLKGSGKANSSAPTNLSLLLSGLTKSMQKQKDITLSNFRYSGDQRELQVNIVVKGLGELGQFRDVMTANGLESGSPRTTRQEDNYQASMKISEKK